MTADTDVLHTPPSRVTLSAVTTLIIAIDDVRCVCGGLRLELLMQRFCRDGLLTLVLLAPLSLTSACSQKGELSHISDFYLSASSDMYVIAPVQFLGNRASTGAEIQRSHTVAPSLDQPYFLLEFEASQEQGLAQLLPVFGPMRKSEARALCSALLKDLNEPWPTTAMKDQACQLATVHDFLDSHKNFTLRGSTLRLTAFVFRDGRKTTDQYFDRVVASQPRQDTPQAIAGTHRTPPNPPARQSGGVAPTGDGPMRLPQSLSNWRFPMTDLNFGRAVQSIMQREFCPVSEDKPHHFLGYPFTAVFNNNPWDQNTYRLKPCVERFQRAFLACVTLPRQSAETGEFWRSQVLRSDEDLLANVKLLSLCLIRIQGNESRSAGSQSFVDHLVRTTLHREASEQLRQLNYTTIPLGGGLNKPNVPFNRSKGWNPDGTRATTPDSP